MKLRVFKPAAILLVALLAANSVAFSQDIVKPVAPVAPVPLVAPVVAPVISTDIIVEPVAAPVISITPIKVDTKALRVSLHTLKVQLKHISVKANAQVIASVNNLNTVVNADMINVAPQIDLAFKDGADVSYTQSGDNDGNADLTKNYSKTYPVDANDQVVIDNRYGKVTVNTWARNEVKVDVQIKVGADNGDDAQKVMDNVSISDAKDGNSVAFKTNINEIKNSWMSIFKGNNGNHRMEINYTVYMPAKNDLVIANSYGAIVIPDMDGKVTISSAYGSLQAGSIAKESALRIKYGNANIGNVGTTAIDLSYGNITLGSADRIAANVSYSGITIAKIVESGSLNVRYGDGVRISDLGKNMKDLAMNLSYSNVNIGLSGDENADFAITVHYGDFNYGNHNVTLTGKNPDNNDGKPHFTREYKGYLGKGGSGKNIAINASYGNVKFD